jgi:exonuclease III
MWNVRGLNAHKKQLYLDRLIRDQRPDIVMLNETKLTSKLFLEGYFSH